MDERPNHGAPDGAGSRAILVAVEGRSDPSPATAAARVAAGLRVRFPDRDATVLVASWRGGEVVVVPAAEAEGTRARGATPAPPPATEGGIPGPESPLGALLREADRRAAAAVALVASEPHDEAADWLGNLLGPIVGGEFDFVSPAYRRHKTDGTLNTGIVYPLMRALYGRRLRQPLGGEAALSLALVRRLLADPDWRREPAQVGSDAWLVAKVLAGGVRACQAWLGAWPRPEAHREDASQTLTRVVGLVFREMERNADRWQRVEGSEPLTTFGAGGLLDGEPPRVHLGRLAAAFQLGQRELAPLWGLVLPPATLLALRRKAALPEAELRIEDQTWARIVYDFAVAHFARSVERRQLLRSLTPLYLGWVAGFVGETLALDGPAAEARIEALCAAFEREKRYLISRWRWPDGFNP